MSLRGRGPTPLPPAVSWSDELRAAARRADVVFAASAGAAERLRAQLPGARLEIVPTPRPEGEPGAAEARGARSPLSRWTREPEREVAA